MKLLNIPRNLIPIILALVFSRFSWRSAEVLKLGAEGGGGGETVEDRSGLRLT